MSACGTKQTSQSVADACPLSGAKRTSLIRSLMSANDPKRTLADREVGPQFFHQINADGIFGTYKTAGRRLGAMTSRLLVR